jgi:hypothetical protein
MGVLPDGSHSVHIGDRFHRLTVIGPAFTTKIDGSRRSLVVCQCDCGAVVCRRTELLGKAGKSCGCLRVDLFIQRATTHGMTGKNGNRRLYAIWGNMKARCQRRTNKRYADYGGRGIKVCDEWQEFQGFLAWATASGYCDPLKIERKDNDGNYEPGNCRWATSREQQNNMRANVWIEAFGDRKTIAEWSRDSRCGVPMGTLRTRLARGWSIESAIASPNKKTGSHERNEQCDQS